MDFKRYIEKYPNLISLVSFILFFLVLKYFWRLSFVLALTVSLSLAVHEYSHALAMKLLKMPVKAVLFIPFLGAVAIGGYADRLWTKREECIIALAGPIGGFLTAIPVYFLFKFTGNKQFAISIVYIIFINLFNLLPLSILDGGRVINCILKSLENKKIAFCLWIGLTSASIAILFKLGMIYFIVLIILLSWQSIREDWNLYQNGIRLRTPLSIKSMFIFGSIYLALVASPFAMVYLWSLA